MLPSDAFKFDQRNISLLALGILIYALPLMGYLTPRVLAFTPIVFTLLGFWALRSCARPMPCIRSKALIMAAAIAALGMLSSLWSINPDESLSRAIRTALVIIPGAVLFSQFRGLNKTAIPGFAKYFSLALIAAMVLLLIDLYTRAGLYFITHDTDPDVDNFSNLNRSTIAVLFFSLASAYAVWQSDRITKKTKTILWAALSLCLAAIMFKTHSQSAQFGAILAASLWLGFPLRSKAAWIALASILSAAILAAPWMVQFAYNNIAEVASQSGFMADAYVSSRLEIWDFVARKALESPWVGYGMEATRSIDNFDSAKLYMPLDYVLHPHNFALQIWIEFGALGAVLSVAFINCVLYRVYKHPCPRDRRFMLMIFVTLLGLAATSYGLWQGWWLGLFVHMGGLCALLQTLEYSQPQTDQQKTA